MYNNIHGGNFKLKTNAVSFHSNLGRGGNDLLGLVMYPDLYLIITGLDFNHPYHPGYFPVIPYGATGAIIKRTCAPTQGKQYAIPHYQIL